MDRDYPEPPPVDNARWLQLGKGKFALIDEADYPSLSKILWRVVADKYVYGSIKDNGQVPLTRFLLGDLSRGTRVSHVNGDTFDCRRANLFVRRVRKSCAYCGQEFSRRRYRKDEIYCSISCSAFARAVERRSFAPPPEVDGAAWLPLQDGHFALVDEDMVDLVKDRIWYRTFKGYAAASVKPDKPGRLLLHRLVIGATRGEVVDHVNGDTLDNRRQNLRIVNGSQHAGNAKIPRHNSSGLKGVCRDPGGKWRAKCAGQYLGLFLTAEEAAGAYDKAARERWGSCAALNFPQEGEQPCHR